jgi:tetratricopeptide (TPR) repeat protein
MQFIKKYWLIISVIGLILIAALKLTDPGSSAAIFEQKLDSILPKDRNNFNFTNTVIALSALIDPDTDIAWTEKEIARMSGEVKKSIGDEGSPENIINAFNNYFFDQEGFKFDKNFTDMAEKGGEVSEETLRNFHSIEKTLKRRRGICLSISLIYLMIGDKLHLPLYGVLIPGHIYVRYKEPGRAGVNIETTFSGAEYYGYKDSITLLSPKTAYGKELDKYSVIGAYLSNLGNYFILTGQNKKAAVMFKKSIEILPDSAEAYLNTGILCETEKKNALAEENYEKTLQMLPGNGYAHYRLGALYLSEQRFTKAQGHLEEAIKTKTGGSNAVKLLEQAKHKEGN